MSPLLWFATFVALTLASTEDNVYQSTLRAIQYPKSLIPKDKRISFAAEYWPYLTLNVTLGTPPQDFEVLVDTDVGELVVYDSECNECKKYPNVQLYEDTHSTTYYFIDTATFKFEHTNYYDNEGLIASDTFEYGDDKHHIISYYQTFYRAQKYMPRYPGANGFFGMAIQPSLDYHIVPPVTAEAHYGSIKLPIFTMFVTKNPETGLPDKGLITYGAHDASHCAKDIHYVPLTNDDRWEIVVKAVKFRNYAYVGGQTAAVTSQDVMILPQFIYEGIVGETELTCDSNGMVKCIVPDDTDSSRARRLDHQSESDNPQAPESKPQALTFVLTDNHELDVKKMIYKRGSLYYLSVLPRKSAAFTKSNIEFGHTLLFEWCTIHDLGKYRIGFSKHKRPVESELDKCTLPSK